MRLKCCLASIQAFGIPTHPSSRTACSIGALPASSARRGADLRRDQEPWPRARRYGAQELLGGTVIVEETDHRAERCSRKSGFNRPNTNTSPPAYGRMQAVVSLRPAEHLADGHAAALEPGFQLSAGERGSGAPSTP